VAIRFVLLADGISYATVSWIHMTILAIHVLFLGVRRQRRSGLRSNRQSCEQYDRPQLPLFFFSPVTAWLFADGPRIIYDGGRFDALVQVKGRAFSVVSQFE
jgi:hypothetical protein